MRGDNIIVAFQVRQGVINCYNSRVARRGRGRERAHVVYAKFATKLASCAFPLSPSDRGPGDVGGLNRVSELASGKDCVPIPQAMSRIGPHSGGGRSLSAPGARRWSGVAVIECRSCGSVRKGHPMTE
jgi:hypothetical protein